MKTFTKVANYIFRCSIVAALVMAFLTLTSVGKVLGDAMEGVTDDNVDAFLTKLAGVNLADGASKAKIAAVIIIVAFILSIVAFKATGKLAAIFRSIVLVFTAMFAALTSFLLSTANIVSCHMAGTATDAEFAKVQEFVEVFTKQGESEGMAVGGLSMLGCFGIVLVTGVLFILLITSIVSVVKTVRAETITD